MKHTPSALHCSRLPSWLPSKADPLIIRSRKNEVLIAALDELCLSLDDPQIQNLDDGELWAVRLTPERKGVIMNESKRTTPTVSQKMAQEAFLKIYRKMVRDSWAATRKLVKEDDLNNKDK